MVLKTSGWSACSEGLTEANSVIPGYLLTVYSDENTVAEIFFSHSFEWSHLSVSSDDIYWGHNLFSFQKLFIINSKMNFLFLFFSYALSDQIAWNRLGNNSKNELRNKPRSQSRIKCHNYCFCILYRRFLSFILTVQTETCDFSETAVN